MLKNIQFIVTLIILITIMVINLMKLFSFGEIEVKYI